MFTVTVLNMVNSLMVKRENWLSPAIIPTLKVMLSIMVTDTHLLCSRCVAMVSREDDSH